MLNYELVNFLVLVLNIFNILKRHLEQTNYKRTRMHRNQVRRAFFPQLEENLKEDILARRGEGAVVNGVYIINKAKSIASELNLHNFIGSRGWMLNFLKRNNLVLRRITSGGKQLPINSKEIINEFHENCQNKRIGRSRSQIYNFDETNIQFDSPGNYTYDTKGAKNVYGTIPGHEKVFFHYFY